jgi:hypothetical protein
MAASMVHSFAPASDAAITPFITPGSGDVDSRLYDPKGFTVSVSRRLRLLKLTANVQTRRSSRHHAAGPRPCDIPTMRPDSGRRAARTGCAPPCDSDLTACGESGSEIPRIQREAPGLTPERLVEPAIDRERARNRRDLEISRHGGVIGREQQDDQVHRFIDTPTYSGTTAP